MNCKHNPYNNNWMLTESETLWEISNLDLAVWTEQKQGRYDKAKI